jgi:predicted metal-dependent peptidase
MRRNIVIILMVALAAAQVAGCASLQKKFTRKKKEEPKKILYKPVKEYSRKPAIELYQTHYLYWKAWQSDLLERMGKNKKKDVLCMAQIISNLEDMKGLLREEKAVKLEAHIAKLKKAQKIIVSEELSTYNETFVRDTLDRESRAIKREFSLKKVRDFLIKDSDEQKTPTQ